MKRLIAILILISSASYAQRLNIDKINHLAAFRGLNMMQEVDSLLHSHGYQRYSAEKNVLIYTNHLEDWVSVAYDGRLNKYVVKILTMDDTYYRSLVSKIKTAYSHLLSEDTYEVYDCTNGVIQAGTENDRYFITRVVDPPQF